MSDYSWENYDIGSFDEEELEKAEMAFSGGIYIGYFRFFPAYAVFRSGMAPLVFPLNADGKEAAKAQKDKYNEATGEKRKTLSARVLECDAEQVINRETEWAPSRIIPGFAEAWRTCLKPSLQDLGLPTDNTWAHWLCVVMVQDPGDQRTDEERTKDDGTIDRVRSTFKVVKAYNDQAAANTDAELFIAEGAEALGISVEETETPATAAGPKEPDPPSGEWEEYPDDWRDEITKALKGRAETFDEEIADRPSPVKRAALVQAYTDIAIALGAEADDVRRWDEHLDALHVKIA